MTEYMVGLQSYTYRKHPLEKLIQDSVKLGLNAVELWEGHLPLDSSTATVNKVREALESNGIRICGIGVINISERDPEGVLDFASRLGADYVSVDFDPGDEKTQQKACDIAQEVGMKLAIHNHGPGHHFATPDDIRPILDSTPESMGVCMDTGHFLRSGVDALSAIESLSPRIYAVHLKDFVDEKTEVPPGKGRLDLPAVVDALKSNLYQGCYIVEYEERPEDPMPDLVGSFEQLQRALEGRDAR